jgi:hypothetical protein
MHTSPPHLHISTSDGRGNFDYTELEAKRGWGGGGVMGIYNPSCMQVNEKYNII